MTELAGFRVLRRAARGSRARLDVGYADGRNVVLKSTPLRDSRAVVEGEALERGAGPHVVALDDVAADAVRRVLVLERLERGPLADLLERRTEIGAGEVVTLFVPVAEAVERLHRNGVTHGGLGIDAIALRGDGAPVLVGFGSASLLTPGLPEVVLEREPAVLADRRALRTLAVDLLSRVGGFERPAAEHSIANLPDDAAPPLLLARAVAAVAPATSVREPGDAPPETLDPRSSLAAGAALAEPGGRDEAIVLPAPPGARWPDSRALDRSADVSGLEPVATAGADLPASVLAALAPLPGEWRERTSALLAAPWRRWRAAPPSRRRLFAGLAAGAVVLVVALAIPSEPAAPGAEPAAAEGEWRPLEPEGDVDPENPRGAESGLGSEDPAAAVVLLLAERERCLRDLDAACLATVTQEGSGARDADLAALDALQSGSTAGWLIAAPGPPVVVQVLGDSALVELPPEGALERVLVIRTDDGWRLRGYYARETE